MAIVAECPNCGKRFKADEKQAGRKAKCSGCASTFVIGGGLVEAATEAAPAAVASAGARAAPATLAARTTPAPQRPGASRSTAQPAAAPIPRAPIAPAAPRAVGSLPPKQSLTGHRPSVGFTQTPVQRPAAHPGAVIQRPAAHAPAVAQRQVGQTPAAAPTQRPVTAARPAPTQAPIAAQATAPAAPHSAVIAQSPPAPAGPHPAVIAQSPPAPAAPAGPVAAAIAMTPAPASILAATAPAKSAEPATPANPAASQPQRVQVKAVAPAAPGSSRAKIDSLAGDPLALPAAQPSPAESRSRKINTLITIAALLTIVIGAGVVYVPRWIKNMGQNGTGARPADNPDAHVAEYVVGPVLPNSNPVWSLRPDVPAQPLRLANDFRLTIAAQPPLRFNPASLILAAPPSPFAAIASTPDSDRGAAETISIWNLTTQSRTAQFRLAQHLAFPAISRDGEYYAGQAWEESSKSNRVEIWSTSRGQLAHAISNPGPSAIATDVVIGFPVEDQVAILGVDKLQVWDLKTKAIAREIPLPPRSIDTHVAASARFNLVAVADSRRLYLVDLAEGKVVGPAPIPEALASHRNRLSLQAIEFSPDGGDVGLVFDNRQSARRIAVFDVATGRLKEIHTPAAPVYRGGPDFQWLSGGNGFLVGAGILIDRATSAQAGQIYGDLPDEGLGGVLAGLLGDDRALIAWDKHPKSLVLRSIPVAREKASWLKVSIVSASAVKYDQLACIGREFGNSSGTNSALLQNGRFIDRSQVFLVVETAFAAALADDAPASVALRPDQFALIADGQARAPIGTLTPEGVFSVERPEYEFRKGDSVAPRRSIVFPCSGRERSIALRIGNAFQALDLPRDFSPAPAPTVIPSIAERLPGSAFSAENDTQAVVVDLKSARLGTFEAEPAIADQAALRVTYSPADSWLLTVTFDLTVNAARIASRTVRPGAPRLGLLLADGTHIRPAVQFPGPLPETLKAGEKIQQTCLFVLMNDPGRSRTFRLTYDNAPVAIVKPDTPTARSVP